MKHLARKLLEVVLLTVWICGMLGGAATADNNSPVDSAGTITFCGCEITIPSTIIEFDHMAKGSPILQISVRKLEASAKFPTFSLDAAAYGNEDYKAFEIERSYGIIKTAANLIINPNVQDTYHVRLVITDSANPQISVSRDLNIVFIHRALTLTAASHTWTFDGQPHSDTSVSVTKGSLISGCRLTAEATGSVTNVADTAKGNNTLSRENVQIYYGTGGIEKVSDSYDITLVPGTLTILPKAITVTAENTGKTYGESDPAGFTYSVPQGALIGTDTLSGALSREAGEDAGTYRISGTLTHPNYAVTINPGTFTIAPADGLAVRLADADYTYDGSPKALAELPATNARGGKTSYSGSFEENGNYVSDLNSLTKVDAGTYTIYVKAQNPNYNDTARAAAKLTIHPRSITGAAVSLDRTQLTYNATEQTVNVTGVTIDGLSLTDNDYIVTGNKGADTVTYTLTVTGRGNFTDSVTAEWTIAEDAMNVSAAGFTGVHDGQPHGITVSVTNPSVGAVVKYGTTAGNYELDASPTLTDIGTMTVYFKGTAENYIDYTGSATVTVTESPVYSYAEGNLSDWTKGSQTGLDFTITAGKENPGIFEKFTGLALDGSAVAAENYTAASGSVKLTLQPSWLETLAAGKHTLTANFTDGKAETTFTIKEAVATPTPTATVTPAATMTPAVTTSPAATPKPSNAPTYTPKPVPKTGDGAPLALWLGLFLAGAISLIALTALQHKRLTK